MVAGTIDTSELDRRDHRGYCWILKFDLAQGRSDFRVHFTIFIYNEPQHGPLNSVVRGFFRIAEYRCLFRGTNKGPRGRWGEREEKKEGPKKAEVKDSAKAGRGRKKRVCQQHRRMPRKHAGRVAPSLLFFSSPTLLRRRVAFVSSPILILSEGDQHRMRGWGARHAGPSRRPKQSPYYTHHPGYAPVFHVAPWITYLQNERPETLLKGGTPKNRSLKCNDIVVFNARLFKTVPSPF